MHLSSLSLYSGPAGCRLCPRQCSVDRSAGETGFCTTGPELAAAGVWLHHGEEPVLGNGTVANLFLAHCTLQCRFCQNWQISRNTAVMRFPSPDEIYAQLISMLESGVDTVGFVSPGHQLPAVLQLISRVEAAGYRPVWVYNSSGYENPELLRAIEGRFDVYLPDFKYADPELAAALSGAVDYPAAALRTLREMFRQKGARLELDNRGRAVSGLIIRHMVLPGSVANSVGVLQQIAEELSTSVHISLMCQYTPSVPEPLPPPFDRAVNDAEWAAVLDLFEACGFYNGWVQEPASAGFYLPDFSSPRPFGD